MQIKNNLAVLLLIATAASLYAAEQKNKTKKTRYDQSDVAHPYYAFEDLDVLGGEDLRIGGMCFHRDQLYVTTLRPDRGDGRPDHAGKLLRIENVLSADSNNKIEITELCSNLYEPMGIGIVGTSIYVGEKHRIIRFSNGVHQNKLDEDSAIIVLDAISTENFHTYTVGFEPYEKDDKQYLCGNFTSPVMKGGRRSRMIAPNPKVHRGSTFIFGPLTGSEAPKDVEMSYLAGGFRTPNGVEVGPDNEVYVTDNQGIFNPTNELIRLEKGGFYGHFQHTEDGRAAAFQPESVDPETGGGQYQKAATIHLHQGIVARSPAQPHVIRDETGPLAPYKGQLLITELTMGRILRASLEEVDGVWQGVVFKHCGGVADENGANGLTAGPNRIERGPDGNYYVGQIGAGGLWQFTNRSHGLQRMRVKSTAEVPPDFNEILNVTVCEGGFEIEFLKPIAKDSLELNEITVSQWTYVPTPKYGGSPENTEKLKPTAIEIAPDRKRATLIVNGLKDASEQFVVKKTGYSSANTGYVVHVTLDPKKDGKPQLYTTEFWYTLHKVRGSYTQGKRLQMSNREKAKLRFESMCMSCHRENDAGWAAPDLKGILGRKQTVIRDGKKIEIVVDRKYLINAILNPMAEKSETFKNAVMPPVGLTRSEASQMVNYILKL